MLKYILSLGLAIAILPQPTTLTLPPTPQQTAQQPATPEAKRAEAERLITEAEELFDQQT